MKIAVTVLMISVAALLALGMVMLYSIGMSGKGTYYLFQQLISFGLGLAACVIAACVDYRLHKKYAWLLFLIGLVLLALIWVPGLGVEAKGARRWLKLGSFQLQSSEVARLTTIIFLAWYAEKFQRQMPNLKRGIVIPSLLIAPILALIFIQPDRGSTVFLGAICGLMLLIAGARWRYLIPPVFLALVGLAVSLWLDPMRSERIYSWLNLEETRMGKGYQAYESMVAFGSGGWTGRGLGNSRQKFGAIPEHHTDFILPIIGEELGLVATLLVLAGYGLILWSGVYIALRASDAFGLMLASGITFSIGLQAFINIGVVTSALPNKGLPLPFISYGGSNLLVLMTALGLLLSIARRATPEAIEDLARPSADDAKNPFKLARNPA